MFKNHLELNDHYKITLSDEEISQLERIVKEWKVFWTVLTIRFINQDGMKVKTGFALVLVAKRKETPICSNNNIFQELRQIANWLIPKDNPNIRFEIKTNHVYIQGEMDTKRKNYILSIRIWHNVGKDRPIDSFQKQALKEMEDKLKKIGSSKDQWKEHTEDNHD